MTNFDTYLKTLKGDIKAGHASEHTHRPTLKALLEGLREGVVATNEPKRVKAGAPDFLVELKHVQVGFIECKDTHVDVDAIEDGEQISRYRANLIPANLVVTNYKRFIWYVDGERRMAATLDKELHQDVSDLLGGFLSVSLPSAATPKDLAQQLARLAHLLRETTATVLNQDGGVGPLHEQLEAFRSVLAKNMTEKQFTDMYAQTITYGLFAARCFHTGADRFTRKIAAFDLPKTNPFLRQMFRTVAGPDLDDRIAWIVDCIANVLATSDMTGVLEHFGRTKDNEDPVVHFYETFLAEYDPKLKEVRGVYYTPVPVVQYIVRSIDYLLRAGFSLEEGIADRSKIEIDGEEIHQVLLLDPAVGTGTFLQGIIDLVHERLIEAGQGGIWDAYVKEHLLPRILGFEFLMAPYAVAHMKLGMTLQEYGYGFTSDERLRVYLTNTLEEVWEFGALPIFGKLLEEEVRSAGNVKEEQPIMVVLGNPPYSGHSANKATKKLKQYAHAYKKDEHGRVYPELAKPGQAKWLSDDYVKFIRFAETRIEKTGHGIVAFITNHAWLDNPTFFGMRKKLYEAFDEIWILDLHGNSKKKEKAPNGAKDENVFDIQQGVAISIFVRYQDRRKAKKKKLHHAHLWGSRPDKYEFLQGHGIENTTWKSLVPRPAQWPGAPAWLFTPIARRGLWDEFADYWGIPDVFSELTKDPAPGILTTHDQFAISWTEPEAIDKVERLLATKSEREARSLFKLCTQDQWKYERAKASLTSGDWRDQIIQIFYRPLDMRHTVYDPNVAVHRRERVSGQMLDGKNIALLTTRMAKGEPFNHAFVTRYANEIICLSPKTSTNAFSFPLWVYDHDTPIGAGGKRPNLNDDFVSALPGRPKPEHVFAYVYAILSAPSYRERYGEILRMDWPRVPTTDNEALFRRLARLGQKLIDLHVWNTKPDAALLPSYPVQGTDTVEKMPKWDDGKVWINQAQYFDGVSRLVWDFLVGGYEPARKWLKDRKGRVLSFDDLEHYRRMVGVLAETEETMRDIDTVIADHGGWPLG